jgi:uncharacterized protein
MIERTIFKELVEHLKKPQVTVITGMRRVGKSTALKYLLKTIEHDNKVYIDLEKVENRFLFNQPTYKDIEINLAVEGIDLSQPAVIALDEIQLIKESTSIIKYLYDTYHVKFIVTGSSSFYLKNRFSESLAGRKQIFEMFPLDFKEFLAFKGQNTEGVSQFAMKPFIQAFYLKWKVYYEEYLRFGGFPEVVLSETEKDKKLFLDEIINAYIQLDILLLSDFSAADNLYKLIRLLASRAGSKTDFTKLSTILGINRHQLKDYINLLEFTYFIQPVSTYTQNADREISKQQKYYFSDTGILQNLAQINSGQVFENAIALQLKRLGKVQYFQKLSGQEIDFIFDEKIAIEVKETPTPKDFAILKNRSESIKLSQTQLIGRYPPATDFKDFIWGGSIF